jgi:hypothetical protein
MIEGKEGYMKHALNFAFILLAALLLSPLTALEAGEKADARFAAMTPAEVRTFELDVMRRIADLALIPPNLNTAPLPKYDYDQLAYGMTIGIERTPKGRLWACWVAGGDSPKAFFVLATSDDDGEKWSKPRLVVDAHSPHLPMDRSVLVGDLWTDPPGPALAVLRSIHAHVRWTCRGVGRGLRGPGRRAARVVRAKADLARRHAEQAHGPFHRRMDAADLSRSA